MNKGLKWAFGKFHFWIFVIYILLRFSRYYLTWGLETKDYFVITGYLVLSLGIIMILYSFAYSYLIKKNKIK